MRTMMRVTMDTEAGNHAIQDGTIAKLIEETSNRIHPEATYFTADGGLRTAYFVFDLQDASEIPLIAEPLFQHLGASIELMPTMNTEELKKGLSRL